MIKRIGRRFVSLLLTFVTILTMLPAMTLPALAAASGTVTGLDDKTIGLSFDGNAGKDKDNPWTAGGTQIKCSVTIPGGCNSKYYSTLTITNNKTTPATLSFDYDVTLNDGTIQVDGTMVTAGGKFTKENLASGGSIKVYIKAGSKKAATEITMSNVNLVADLTATVTFQPAKNGSYSVDGRRITETYENTQSAMKSYQVMATPNEGYQFLGWYDVTNGRYIHTNATAALRFDSDCTITALFASKTAALFETGGWLFDKLNEAVAYAQANNQKKITLASDGKITGNYTIPSGVTLLIPFDEAKTLYTNKPDPVGAPETQKAYKTLTMPSGSSIEVYGAISVGGKHFAGSSGSCCKTTGQYGQIIMQEGSSITLYKDANLYAWGYITGDGEITATSGSTVYEYFQVADWRGGKAVLSMITKLDNHVFPFSQYYVQNIEAPLTIQNGAAEKAYYSVAADGVGTNSVIIDFIGSKKSLFRIYEEGELTKKYDPKTDRITYTTTGSASLDSLAISLAGLYTIDSKNYVLPVNNNMTLEILSGKVAVNCDAALLPGAQITIAQGAELSVSDGKSLYVYDQNQWGPYCINNKEFVPVPYTPTPKGTRTLANATINVNGTLTAVGNIYTTESGANICSSEGGGRFVQQSKPGKGSTTHQATQKGSDVSYDSIPITPAKLKNNGNSYIETKDAVANDTFTYCKCSDCGGGKWTNGLKVAEIDKNDGTPLTTHETLKEAVGKLGAGQYIKMLHNTTEDITAEDITADTNLYLDLNGRTVTGNFTMNDKTLFYGMDSTTDKYDGANAGKIVGSVTPYAKTTYQTPTVTPADADGNAYKRYVAIQGLEADKKTANLSFHRFNISVTGYRFELEAPECALIFCGKFQGDRAAKNHLKSLGFTLKDGNDKEFKKDSPEMSEALKEEYVKEEGDAYLFELYLKRSFDRNSSDNTAYTEEFSATAQATFKNSGVSEDNSLSSEERKLSFQKALWDALSAPDMEEKDREILMNFLNDMNIPNPTPNPNP